MKEKIFDRVAAEYERILADNLGKYGKNIAYYAEYKVLKIKKQLLHEVEHILEFGCGTGRNMPFLRKYFPTANLYGYDDSEESIQLARQDNPQVQFLTVQDVSINQHKYDLILVANVFHHIPPRQCAEVMRSIKSLLSSGGEIFIFEHNPFNPLTVRAVNTCPFDKDVVLLRPGELMKYVKQAGLDIIKMNYCLFFPAALRKIRSLEIFFTFIPLGAQYFIQAKG
jgi:SAM-dependent methyltransferase